MDARRYMPSRIHRPNRPDPLSRIPRRKPDVAEEADGTFSLLYLTRSQAELVRDVCAANVRLYGLHTALTEMLGLNDEVSA